MIGVMPFFKGDNYYLFIIRTLLLLRPLTTSTQLWHHILPSTPRWANSPLALSTLSLGTDFADLWPSFVMETLTRCWIAAIWSDMSLRFKYINHVVGAISGWPSILGQHLIITSLRSNMGSPKEDELGRQFTPTTHTTRSNQISLYQ